jgi:hypothetical protein
MTFTIPPALALEIFTHEVESLSDSRVVLGRRLDCLETIARDLFGYHPRYDYTAAENQLDNNFRNARQDYLQVKPILDRVDLQEVKRDVFIDGPVRDVSLWNRLGEVYRLLVHCEDTARRVQGSLR